jgi:hypothetical protein
VDALTNRLGTRFLAVTVIPNALLIAYVGFLIAAGAPARSPSLGRALMVLDRLTLSQIIAIILGLLIISVATHPLQTPLIQLVEGYWWGLPFGPGIMDRFTDRFRDQRNLARKELRRLQAIPKRDWNWAAEQSFIEARRRLFWLPAQQVNLLPTALGNTLRTGEVRAGSRYGLSLDLALPRLAPLMGASSLADLRDRRNQLDAAVRLCIAAGVATAASIGLLLSHGPWLFLALGTYLLCWACYQSGVAAARGFSNSLAAAVDLHHLQLFDSLQLKRPADLADELRQNATLTKLFRGERLDVEQEASLSYLPAKVDKAGAG